MDNAVVIILVALYIAIGTLLYFLLFLETRKSKRSFFVAIGWPLILVIGGVAYLIVSILTIIASPFMCASHDDTDLDHTFT